MSSANGSHNGRSPTQMAGRPSRRRSDPFRNSAGMKDSPRRKRSSLSATSGAAGSKTTRATRPVVLSEGSCCSATISLRPRELRSKTGGGDAGRPDFTGSAELSLQRITRGLLANRQIPVPQRPLQKRWRPKKISKFWKAGAQRPPRPAETPGRTQATICWGANRRPSHHVGAWRVRLPEGLALPLLSPWTAVPCGPRVHAPSESLYPALVAQPLAPE